jgi:signal transduction histidine kinase
VEFQGDLNTKRESIETLAEGLERISSLLDSLLEWALCASGRLKLESSPVNMAAVIEEAISDIQSTASDKMVTIESTVDGSFVAGDKRALATVFRNLFSNAVKYSRSGSMVRVSGARTDGTVTLMHIEVEDHGTGMKSEQLSKLFVPGRTLLTLGTNGEQGKGFGLAISKLFVDAMGGTMGVESELGVGTRFVLDFPIATFH